MARRAEDLGYASAWVFQRLFYPVAPRNEYYGSPGAWPEAFRSALDPVVALAWAAAHTRTLRLGVSVLVMPFYQPLVLAKQLATLDVVASGRLDVGVGIGWSVDEFEAAGVPADRRGARADEFLKVLTAAWGDDPVEFAGEFYRIPRAHVRPKPVQRPRPPLLVGGYSEAVLRRAATLADGYTGGNIPLADLEGVVARVRSAARAAGRNPDGFPIVCRGSFRLTAEPLGAGRRALWGSADEIRDDVARYAAAGVTELFLDPNFQPGGAELASVLTQMTALAPR
ncbi:MAG TPA: TIGR03619 family F420-dependent LLM class oxidoreductase [Methylomirabilota bacterium]|nr:TIGR03619 family F420-dependent LLM class oxidoreductase [Methylomirabilota bacterium]